MSETTTTIWIKGMVCPRCIRVVKEDLENAAYSIKHIELGKVIIEGKPNYPEINRLLTNAGFSIVEDEEERLVEHAKLLIIELIESNYFESNFKTNSHVLEEKLKISYSKLSRIFSSVTGTTLERFIIDQKINKVKELLKYTSQTIEDVAYKLGYSSSAHLSRQFKSITGFTPTVFRKQYSNPQK